MTFAFACGGGEGDGGVDPNTLLVDLLPEESDAVCEAIADLPVEPREIDCGDGTTVIVEEPTQADIDDCADGLDSFGTDSPDCTATVGDMQDCLEDFALASDDELCDGTIPVSCDAIFGDPDCGGV